MLVAPRVTHLHLLDVSPETLAVARENLKAHKTSAFTPTALQKSPRVFARLRFLTWRPPSRSGHTASDLLDRRKAET
jgi:16S rRNA G1207 methylase RsmC